MISANCSVIAVMGGKGGVGKSLFATNLAAALQIELRTPVLLVDADPKTAGDLNVYLGLKPQKSFVDIATSQMVVNAQNLSQILTPHPSGLHLLPAVKGPDEFFKITPELAVKTIENFSKFFNYIVIDLGHELSPVGLAILQESTCLMLVAQPEVLVVNQTQRLISELLAQTFPLEMMQLVLNKTSNNSMGTQTVVQTLKMQPLAVLPQDENTAAQSLMKSTPFVLAPGKTLLGNSFHEIVRKLTGGILQKLKTQQRPAIARPKATTVVSANNVQNNISKNPNDENDPRNLFKIRIHTELIRAMDLKKGITDTAGDPAKEEALRKKTQASITQIVDREGASGIAREDRSKIIKEVLEEALGLGPLEDLLAEPTVTEIMVNGYRKIFVEKSGKITLSPVTFTSNLHLRNVIERIVTPLGRRIDEKTPYVDARLRDGSRVNAVIEPLAIDGPSLTIRKFKKGGITPEKYIEYNSLTKSMVDFLRICVENGLNIVISGGTGSGKTSLLNMFSGFIPSNERVITVEDAAELQLQQEHVVRLETRPANMEGTGAVTIRDLIKNALRMRPDRIIVGETRDGAALDMLQAMNTGHDGSMTTTHANSPRECLSRLETLCLMAGMELPVRAIREQVSSAVQMIVQISRLSDGSRRVTSLTEVCGMQGDTITLQEIFRFKEMGFDKNRKILGQFQAMGMIPTFVEKLEQKGVIIPRDLFSSEGQKESTPKPSVVAPSPFAQIKKAVGTK